VLPTLTFVVVIIVNVNDKAFHSIPDNEGTCTSSARPSKRLTFRISKARLREHYWKCLPFGNALDQALGEGPLDFSSQCIEHSISAPTKGLKVRVVSAALRPKAMPDHLGQTATHVATPRTSVGCTAVLSAQGFGFLSDVVHVHISFDNMFE
jgi:hypothetical protein